MLTFAKELWAKNAQDLHISFEQINKYFLIKRARTFTPEPIKKEFAFVCLEIRYLDLHIGFDVRFRAF